MEVLRLGLEKLLRQFAEQISASEPGVMWSVGSSENEEFLLRTYLSFLKDKNGDEIAVTVDVRNNQVGLLIDVDICNHDNSIIASTSNTMDIAAAEYDMALMWGHWLQSFEKFLYENLSSVRDALSAMG
jgi:hypothetical protein